MIAWESKQSYVLKNPRLPNVELPNEWAFFNEFPDHFWLATSGTTRSKDTPMLWVGLSKDAILASADAVNKHLQILNQDKWALVLPTFHVGGLGILARAYLSHSSVIIFNKKWNPEDFTKFIIEEGITLVSLVPTQITDLVQKQCRCPKSLRVVIVGGGDLQKVIKEKAKILGWPILQSYGMTECASQIATEETPSNGMKLLSHIAYKMDNDRLKIKSPALLTGYLRMENNQWHFWNPKVDDWFLTEDRCLVDENRLTYLGRMDSRIKILGENVCLDSVERFFISLLPENIEGALIAIPDPRLGYLLKAFTTQAAVKSIEQYNHQVMPYERIQTHQIIHAIPRNSLGKVMKHLLTGFSDSNERSSSEG